jgi:hypothetical protein
VNWSEADDERWDEFDRENDPNGDYYYSEIDAGEGRRWPLSWRGLYPRERWLWWEQLWTDACALRARYRISLRNGWWEDEVQVEALAALAAWTQRYDSGEWDDPPGKLALLYDLERVGALLRDGADPFHPDRDRLAFARHLIDLGCQPPPGGELPDGDPRRR